MVLLVLGRWLHGADEQDSAVHPGTDRDVPNYIHVLLSRQEKLLSVSVPVHVTLFVCRHHLLLNELEILWANCLINMWIS